MLLRILSLLALLLGPFVPDVRAQAPEANAGRLRLGAVGVTPTLRLTFGVDDNVFNEPENPKRDLTMTLNPQVEFWLRLGRGRLNGRGSADLVRFKQYSNQGSLNPASFVRLEFPVGRLQPHASASYLRTRDRSTVEIDTRARRFEQTLVLGAKVRALSRTSVDVSATHSATAFEDDAVFLDTPLSQVLNREAQALNIGFRHELTPLTTLTLNAERRRETFEFSPERNATNMRILPGVEFARSALISGRAFVGYGRFDIADPRVPDYAGPVAAVDLASVLRGATRFSVRAERDVMYSFEITEPYYLLSGLSGSITCRLGDRWDVMVNAGRQWLDYRKVRGAPGQSGGAVVTSIQPPPRVDRMHTYGAGLGHWLRRGTRLGLTLDLSRRQSGVIRREYEALRILGSLTYGS